MHGRGLGLGLALGLGVVGCAAKPATTEPAVEPTVTAREQPADAELMAVAAAIDPGPQTPLYTELPAAIREPIDRALGTAPKQGVATREIREALETWDKLSSAGGETFAQNLMKIGAGLILAERAVAAGDDDPELLLALSRVYWILDAPMFAGQGMFQQVLQVAAQLAHTAAPAAGEADMTALMSSLSRVFERAGALHRRSAAEFLRAHGEHPEVPKVLGRLADDALRREDFARAVALRQMAVRRSGARVGAMDHIELAQACFQALELDCGDAALQRARAAGEPGEVKAALAQARRLEQATKLGAQARRAWAIAADAEPTQALERGHLLLLLGRFADAQALYERLRVAHPNDARPHAGLAKLAIQRGGDFSGASAQVELGKPLESKDRDFYEVALGTIGMKFLYEALPAVASGRKFEEMVPPLLADLRLYAAGLHAFDPARARVVQMIEAVVGAAAPGFMSGDPAAAYPALRGALARALVLTRDFPDSPDVRRMVHLAANFAADSKEALAAVRAPLSPALMRDPALPRARAQTWLDVALAWEAADELPAIEAAVAALPEEEGSRPRASLQAAVLALKFRGGGPREAGEQAAAMYTALASEGPPAARVNALNNLGVLQIALGDPSGGAQRLIEALNLDPKAWPAVLNLAGTVLKLEGAQRAELMDGFAMVARESESAPLRLQARAWLHEQAQRGHGDVEQALADFAAALARERKSEIRGSLPLGRWGLIGTGAVQVSFNYSVPDGLQIRNEIDMTLWLIEPAPGLVAAVDRPSKPSKPSKPSR